MNTESPSSGPWITGLQNGDPAVYEKLFREYYTGLLFFVEKQVGDRSTAKDIVQEVFYKLLDNRKSLQHDLNIKGWLYRAARNTALDHLRHLQVEDRNRLLMAEAMLYASEVDASVDEELSNRIAGALESLPDQCRLIIRKKIFERKKYTEIAEELGISVNTIKTQINRGYKKMRETLSSDMDTLILFFSFRCCHTKQGASRFGIIRNNYGEKNNRYVTNPLSRPGRRGYSAGVDTLSQLVGGRSLPCSLFPAD